MRVSEWQRACAAARHTVRLNANEHDRAVGSIRSRKSGLCAEASDGDARRAAEYVHVQTLFYESRLTSPARGRLHVIGRVVSRWGRGRPRPRPVRPPRPAPAATFTT